MSLLEKQNRHCSALMSVSTNQATVMLALYTAEDHAYKCYKGNAVVIPYSISSEILHKVTPE